MCRAIEQMILRRVIGDLLAAKGKVTIDSERGYDPDAKSFTKGQVEAAVKEAYEFDECHIMAGGDHESGYESWVYVIYGNGNCGFDMVSDYSTSLEPILAPINQWVEQIQQGELVLEARNG